MLIAALQRIDIHQLDSLINSSSGGMHSLTFITDKERVYYFPDLFTPNTQLKKLVNVILEIEKNRNSEHRVYKR